MAAGWRRLRSSGRFRCRRNALEFHETLLIVSVRGLGIPLGLFLGSDILLKSRFVLLGASQIIFNPGWRGFIFLIAFIECDSALLRICQTIIRQLQCGALLHNPVVESLKFAIAL